MIPSCSPVFNFSFLTWGSSRNPALSGAVLCRAPEYVDGLLEMSRSLMWGRAIVEETNSELMASSWENLDCRRKLLDNFFWKQEQVETDTSVLN